MAYAHYTNDQVNANNNLLILLGKFEEADYGNVFEFAKRSKDDSNGFANLENYPHVIFVGCVFSDKRTRYAIVKKTVAYVVIDEGINGNPIVDKWNIKNYRKYEV